MLSWSLPNSTFYPSQRSNVDQKGHLAEKGVFLQGGYYRKREVIMSYNYNFRWFFTRKTSRSATSRASRRILALKGDKFLLLIEKNARQYKIPTNFFWEPRPKIFETRTGRLSWHNETCLKTFFPKLSPSCQDVSNFFKNFQNFFEIFSRSFLKVLITDIDLLFLFRRIASKVIHKLFVISTTTPSVPQATPRVSVEGPHLK